MENLNSKPQNQEVKTGWEVIGQDIIVENTDEFNGQTVADVEKSYWEITDAEFQAQPEWYQNPADYAAFKDKFENRKTYELLKREDILGQYYAQKRSQK